MAAPSIFRACPAEAALLLAPVAALSARIGVLLAQWPENQQLARILEVASKLCALPLESPLMRVMTGLETLLARVDEWEVVASRDVTLAEYAKPLSVLVKKWRAVELTSWTSLLSRCEERALADVNHWWFRLFEIIDKQTSQNDAHWIFSASKTTVGHALEPELFEVLDQFLRTSTLGDFARRVDLISAFAGYCQSVHRPVQAAALAHLASYYRQWLPNVKQAISQHKSSIQAKLTEHVKVCKWDDRTFFALKESAERSHRIVHKLARQFDEALATPAHITLEQAGNSLASDNVEVLASVTDTPISLSFRCLDPLPPPSNQQHKASRIVAIQVLPALSAFAENCAPSSLHEAMIDRLSVLKEQPVQMKQRAVIDFLKHLKEQGLLRRADELPSQLADHRAVLSTPLLCPVGASHQTREALQRCNGLFYKSVALHVRLSSFGTKNVHADVARDQYAKALLASSSTVHMLVQHRAALVSIARIRSALVELALALNRLGGENSGVLVKDVVSPLCAELASLVELAKDALVLTVQFDAPVAARNEIASELKAIKAALDARGPCLLPCSSDLELASSVKARMAGVRSKVRALVQSCQLPMHSLAGLEDSEALQGTEAVEVIIPTQKAGGDAETVAACMRACQLVVQAMVLRKEPVELKTEAVIQQNRADDSAEEDDDETVTTQHSWLMSAFHAAEHANAETAVSALLAELSRGQVKGADAASALLPFVVAAVDSLDGLFGAILGWHAECARMAGLLCRVALSLCLHGYCRPPPPSEEGAEQGKEDDAREGTGMGEGQGEKNVSEEIEDEEQLLGLKGEEGKGEQPSKREEEGLEMEGDFEGHLEDVEAPPEDENDEEKEEEDEGEELDREMGDTGPDSNVVDEKLWGSSDDEEDLQQGEEEKTELGSQMPSNTEDVMDAAGDEEDQHKETSGDDEDGAREMDETNASEDDDEAQPKPEQVTEEDHGVARKEDESVEGDEEQEKEAETPEAEDEADMDDSADDEGHEGEEERAADDGTMEVEPNKQDENEGQAQGAAAEKEEEQKEAEPPPPPPRAEEAAATQMASDPTAVDANAAAADSFANAAGEGATQKPRSSNVPLAPQANQDLAQRQSGGGGAMQRGAQQAADDGEAEERGEGQDGEREGGGKTDDEPNPWRDPGNADEAWTRRLRMLNKLKGEAEVPEDGEMHEFAAEGKTQTLGAAKEDENAVLPLRHAEDENPLDTLMEQAEEDDQDDGAMDVEADNEEGDDKTKLPSNVLPPPMSKESQASEEAPLKPAESSNKGPTADSAATAANAEQQHPSSLIVTSAPSESPPRSPLAEANAMLPVDESVVQDPPTAPGREAWARAVDATDEMAHQLCEQLRLIMEPTLANKLKGDYRTGKRLNMRRIIPYIASHFKKDKIWMRRTKPAKRQYQVGLVIDDSQSMKPVGELALASVALISRGLNMLEVGEIGVWSFGDQVRVLHRLEDAFNDEAGCAVASRMSFQQRSTNIESAMASVVEAMSQRAGQLKDVTSPRQLVFVVSDGRFDSGLRSKVKQWTALAKEKGQLVACVIVEPAGGESILDVRQVTFGAAGMKVGKYLEDYPFEYYIVLREQSVLPEVLADALRQWFELIALADEARGD